jgi:hypothetical protein
VGFIWHRAFRVVGAPSTDRRRPRQLCFAYDLGFSGSCSVAFSPSSPIVLGSEWEQRGSGGVQTAMSFSLIDICSDCGMGSADWFILGIAATIVVALIWLWRVGCREGGRRSLDLTGRDEKI